MPTAALPVWSEIRGDLLRMIHTGAWKPGDQIPNEVELASTYGCTRSTVSRALRDLAEAGFLVRRRKSGTRVAANPTRRAPLEVPIIGDAIKAAGHAYRFELVERKLKTAPVNVTQALGMPAGIDLLHVQVVHRGGNLPLQFEDRWLNPLAATGISQADLATIAVDRWLLQFAPLGNATIAIMAEAAGEDIADALDLRTGDPVLVVERTSFRLSKPLSFLRLVHRPGHRITTAI
ncbi:UTRA domain-containing protein [Mesorhizobium sp. CAU 1741]|uniref:UTRA domain-containing protein n=1 Tax=Mesorhizobium sp. CAU 1741 TaxID=3140366 RepID=UPI00325A92E9